MERQPRGGGHFDRWPRRPARPSQRRGRSHAAGKYQASRGLPSLGNEAWGEGQKQEGLSTPLLLVNLGEGGKFKKKKKSKNKNKKEAGRLEEGSKEVGQYYHVKECTRLLAPVTQDCHAS